MPISRLLACELQSCSPPDQYLCSVHGGQHLLVRGVFGKAQRVCDVDRYRVIRGDDLQLKLTNPDNSPIGGEFVNDSPQQEFEDCKTLIVLLESPHRQEFDSNLVPIGPAMGPTGRNLLDGLIDAIGRSPAVCERIASGTRVIVANPVQFQTSLFAIHRNDSVPKCRRSELRNTVWTTIWSVEEVQKDFINRIRGYRPHTILNLCTGNRSPKGLKAHVTRKLVAAGFGAQLFVGPHPSWPQWRSRAKFRRLPPRR